MGRNRRCHWTRRCGLALIGLTLLGGCTRKFFRNRTDAEVEALVRQKDQFAAWSLGDIRVYPDEKSRFADPSNPDRPPQPTDDYAASVLAPNPQKPHHAGYGTFEGTGWFGYLEHWDALNRAARPPKPDPTPKPATDPATTQPEPSPPTQPAPSATEQPAPNVQASSFENALKSVARPFIINPEQSCELALFNSREYQDRREDLYLSALPVSLQRFAFSTQFFATESLIREATGRETAEGRGNRWRANTDAGFSKRFFTGATLLLAFANRTVIELGSDRPQLSASNLSLDLTQPFLRGGGRAVTLEPLTQTERNLVYAVRSFARFRKVYYAYLISGDEVFNSPFTFAGLSTRGVGFSLTAASQGYLPTVLLTALERTASQNVVALEDFYRRFQAFEEGGDVSRLQVDQVEQQLLSGRASLLTRRNDTQNGYDQFKLQLGVPVPTPINLDDKPIDPLRGQIGKFEEVRALFDAVRLASDGSGLAARRLAALTGGSAVASIWVEPSPRKLYMQLLTQSPAVRGTEFAKTIGQRLAAFEAVSDDGIAIRLTQLSEKVRAILNEKALLEVQNRRLTPAREAELTAARRSIVLGRLEQSLRTYEKNLKIRAFSGSREQAAALREVANVVNLVLGEARAERLDEVRDSWPELPAVCLSGTNLLEGDLDQTTAEASRYALDHRFELMNSRGQLVDAWRQIRVQANALQGVFDVRLHVDTNSPTGQNLPFALGGSRSRGQLFLNFELPLVRRAEALAYRTSLIAFQRQRRFVQATEDFIVNDVRTDLRQLRLLAENYKIQQRAVEVAFALVENSLDVLQAPADPRQANGQTAGGAAALTQQLLNAQSSLLQAQNTLYTVYVNYLIARIRLYRDLELLPLDLRGSWDDDHTRRECDCDSAPDAGGSPGGDPVAAPGRLLPAGRPLANGGPQEAPTPAADPRPTAGDR